ncbi:beta-lactamase related protein [Anaeramoeba flamelloides]|uniref:Beta-lactamase related protein n=1 Tax=Anaeramoeba flamelloides TaxID=1746091 RepID=A0ABQ8YFB7_9EUKA|nr:beta-lactamase related protein [Anaeramoeba flamelloides]
MLKIIQQFLKSESTNPKDLKELDPKCNYWEEWEIILVDCNYFGMDDIAGSYILKSIEGEETKCALIDNTNGRSVPIILNALKKYSIKPENVEYIIVTHIHLDHSSGTSGLLKHCSNATVLVHPRGARHMVDPTRLMESAAKVYGGIDNVQKLYGPVTKISEEKVRSVSDGEIIEFGGRKLQFIHTLGHAKHHVCIHDLHTNSLFSGDNFGIRLPALHKQKHDHEIVWPTSTPIGFDPEEAIKTVVKLQKLQPDRIFLAHYGPIFQIDLVANRLVKALNCYWDMCKQAKEEQIKPKELLQYVHKKMNSWFNEFIRSVVENEEQEQIVMELMKADIELNSQGLVFYILHFM